MTLENETKVGLLFALKDFTAETVKGLLMPVKRQKQGGGGTSGAFAGYDIVRE